MRHRISLNEAVRVFGKEKIQEVQKKYPGKRLTFWSDCGLTYATVNRFGGQQTVLSDGMYQGLD